MRKTYTVNGRSIAPESSVPAAPAVSLVPQHAERIQVDAPATPKATYPKAGAVRARIEEVQALLAATKADPSRSKERPSLKTELAALTKQLAAIKDGHKKRSMAGLYSTLFDTIVARFDEATVEELRLEALAKLEERWAKIAEKRAEKATAADTTAK